MTDSFFFLKHPNPHGATWGERQQGPPTCLVLHTAEAKNVSRESGARKDNTAEKLARYGASNDRKVSWHYAVDADSIVPCLPPSLRANHVRGLNEESIGIELACSHKAWGKNLEWQGRIFKNLVDLCVSLCLQYNIPPIWISLDEAKRGVRGFITHKDADPKRRKDPGARFPKGDLVRLVALELNSRVPPPPVSTVPRVLTLVDEMQAALSELRELLV